jgi:hypothetical protein
MKQASDVETLFERFGGDARQYQEIGRENEANTARSRWPLLVTLDLAQPVIPPLQTPSDAISHQAGVSQAAARLAQPGNKPPPLLARAHRHTIPPVDRSAEPLAGAAAASRFSPAREDSQASAASTESTESTEATKPAAPAPVTAVPALAAVRPDHAPISHANMAPAATQPPSTRSILGKLFETPAKQPDTLAEQPSGCQPAKLRDVFARLRGDAQSDARFFKGSRRA